MGLPFFPQPKAKSRLQEKVDAKKLTVVDERAFKKEIWARDQSKCRCCGRKVIKSVAHVPERGEIHHLHGRTGDFRFQAVHALLLCAICHERVTGKVNEKWTAVQAIPTFRIWVGGQWCIDARQVVKFERVA